MKYRRLGKTGIDVSEIGFGAWGIGGGMWGSPDDDASVAALERAFDLGLNFVDTAFDYGDGHSETIVGRVVRDSGLTPGRDVFVATKMQPKNLRWPVPAGVPLDQVFPSDYIVHCVEKSLANLGLPAIDLMQFHVWDDRWAAQDEWKAAIDDISRQGLVRHWGISINDYQPANVIRTLETGLIDVVQVIYNIFEQTPNDALLPTCERLDVGVIARVPLDEGGLTGAIGPDTVFAPEDWRGDYFGGDRARELADHLADLAWLVPATGTANLAEAALRFCLSHPAVSTVIPGMRSRARVEENVAVSDGRVLSREVLERLHEHNWPRNWYPA